MFAIIIFSLTVIIGLIFLKRRFGWRGFRVRQEDVLNWAFYGLLIPIWIQFDYVFTNISRILAYASAIVMGVAFLALLVISKRRGFSMLPIAILATILAYIVLIMVASSSPSDTFGNFRPEDLLLMTAFFFAPPWIAGLAVARYKPKLAILLPAFVIPYNLFLPITIAFAPLSYLIAGSIVFAVARGVGR